MSIARHHAGWLPLVGVSGPFLSMPVLLEAFPQGLEAHDPKLPNIASANILDLRDIDVSNHMRVRI